VPSEGEPARRGRPRDTAVDQRVLDVAWDLLLATERDGLRPDIDHAVLIDQVSGPIYYRVLITGAPADRDYAELLVSAALEGAFGPAAKAAPQTPR